MVADVTIERGIVEQGPRRARLLDDGAAPVGWKLAFGSVAAQQTRGVYRARIGGMTSASRLEPGAFCSCAGWQRPALAAELAVVMAHDGGRLIAGELAWAIGLADLGPGDTDLEEVLACNVVHRAFLLGELR